MHSELLDLIDRLRLKGMHAALDRELLRAEREGLAASDVLRALLMEELRYRQERNLMNRQRQARLPWDWTLASFPFELQPAVSKSQIMELAGLAFLERHENIVFIGPPGAGKTGLATGLLRKALTAGLRCRFYRAQDLLDDLYASLADRSTPRAIKMLSAIDLLVIDELGYLTLTAEQCNAFFKLMEERYGKKSTIITTNLEYEQWYGLFNRKALVDALLDRLRHRCTTIHIQGESLRTPTESST